MTIWPIFIAIIAVFTFLWAVAVIAKSPVLAIITIVLYGAFIGFAAMRYDYATIIPLDHSGSSKVQWAAPVKWWMTDLIVKPDEKGRLRDQEGDLLTQ